MIRNDQELQQATDQLSHLYEALAVLRREVEPKNTALFSLMAEGPVDQIEGIRRDIEEYVGISALVAGEKS